MSGTPRVRLLSGSAATDAAWLAAGDVASVAASLDVEYRLVGGVAITLLVHHHGVEVRVPARETADADMGVALDVLGDDRMLAAIRAVGYTQVEGNRSARRLGSRDLTIGVLGPSYTGRLEVNQVHGSLVVDEVPGLATALSLPPTEVAVSTVLTTGVEQEMVLALPDLRAALILKAYAYRGRVQDRDAVDVWRLLEAASAAGLTTEDWPTRIEARDGAHTLHICFAAPNGRGTRQAVQDAGTRARIRALVNRVVPVPSEA